MARTIDNDTQYRVRIHRNGGYEYASTQPIVVDPERQTGRNKHRRIHWGTVDKDKKFHPNKTYLFAPIEERRKLQFPEDWDMSEVEALDSERGKGRPSVIHDDTNKLYGDIWLLERVAEATGIKDDLLKVFGGNKEMVNAVMTMAMYQFATGKTLNRLAHWQLIERTPCEKSLTASVITHITQSITEQHRMDLFRLRAKKVNKGDLCALDSTSKSAYGDSLADIKWGKNKERLPLRQTNEVVVYDINTHMPIYYRTFPGNIPDSRTIGIILDDLKEAGFPKVIYITDRGYESIRNLERYITDGLPLIMWVKVNQKLVTERIREFKPFGHRPEEMEIDEERKIYYEQYDLDYKVDVREGASKDSDRLKLNLYFDPAKRVGELTRLDIDIKMQRQSLERIKEDGYPMDDDKTIKASYPYFNVEINENDRTLNSFSINEEKVERAKLTSGFFANVTHAVDMTSMKAMESYALRDEQEKFFGQEKGALGCDRQRSWSEDGKNGRLFIQFVAMILNSHVKHVWKSKLKGEFCSTLSVLDEKRPIRIVEHKGHNRHISPFVGKQIDICNAFGFEVPKECSPVYKSKKSKEVKRGRPKKALTIKEPSASADSTK